MERILKYIDENYHNSIQKNEVENLVFCSQRNSQRLFKRFFDETISNFQKRLRLENAYKKLVYSKETIKNIAYDVGYENQSSFNKAFLKHFNITPSKARENKRSLFEDFYNQSDIYKNKIDYEAVYVPSKQIYYKLIITNNYSNETINKLWSKIDINTKDYSKKNFYGLILDQPLISGETKCRYEACIESSQKLDGFLTKQIFGMKYLKFKHSNEFDLIEDTYRKIFYNWVYHFNYEIDNSSIIEHYIKDNNVKNKDGYLTEIYIPIK